MARAYIPTIADYTPKFPGQVFVPQDVRDEVFDGVEVVEETFQVPADPDSEGRYRVILDRVPMDQLGLTVAVTGDGSRLPIPYGEVVPSGRVGVSLVTGVLEFNAEDAAATGMASYRGRGTSIGSTQHAVSGAELAATQQGVLDLAGVVDGLPAAVGALESAVGALESAVGALESAVGDIEDRLGSFAGEVVLDPVYGNDAWVGSRVAPVASSGRVMELLEGMTGLVRVVIRGGATLTVPTRWDAGEGEWEDWPEGLELFFEGEGERGTVEVELGTIEAALDSEPVTLALGFPVVGAVGVLFELSGYIELPEDFGFGRVRLDSDVPGGFFRDCVFDLSGVSGDAGQADPPRDVMVLWRVGDGESTLFVDCVFGPDGGTAISFFTVGLSVCGSWVVRSRFVGVTRESVVGVVDSCDFIRTPFAAGLGTTSDVGLIVNGSVSGDASSVTVVADVIRGLACPDGFTGDLFLTAELVERVYLNHGGMATLTCLYARNVFSRAARFRWDPSAGDAVLDGFDVVETVGGNVTVNVAGRTSGSVTIRNGRFVYSGPWEEMNVSPAGKVMLIYHTNSTAPLHIDNVQYRGTAQFLYRSHPNPANDSNRDTRAASIRISGCDLRWIRADHATSPNDTRGIILVQGRGLVEILNTHLEVDQSAVSTPDDDLNGCIVRIQAGSGGFASLSAGGVPVAAKLVNCHCVYIGRTGNGGSGSEYLWEVVTNASADPVNKGLELVNVSVSVADDIDEVVGGTSADITVRGGWVGPQWSSEAGWPTWVGMTVGDLRVEGELAATGPLRGEFFSASRFGSATVYNAIRANGSEGSETDLGNSDQIGRYRQFGWLNGGLREPAYFESVVDGAPSGSNLPGRWDFYTRNTSGTIARRMSIRAAGQVEFGVCTTFLPIAAASVPNNSIFLDSADNALKRKDNSGSVIELSGR